MSQNISSDWRKGITFTFAILAIAFAVYSIQYYYFDLAASKPSEPQVKGFIILLVWIFVPPIWFFAEQYALWKGVKGVNLELGRELAKPIWAAVLATLLFLMPECV